MVLITMFFFFSLVILSDPCEQKAIGWKGKIEIKDGVKVIMNPTEPQYGEIWLELEEDIRIGTDKDLNYLFYRIRDIKVDTDGIIYVLDSGNNRIQVFDNKGKYLSTIGKEGQGPGELNAPVCLQINDETKHIFVTDRSRRIIIFDKGGTHIDRDIHLVEYLTDFYLDSDDSIWGRFLLPAPAMHLIKKISPTGKVEKTFAEIPYPINSLILSHSKVGNAENTEAYFFTHGYEYDVHVSKVINHIFIYGYSNEYKLHVVDEAGEVLFIIRKYETPKEIAKNEKEQVINLTRQNLLKRGKFVPEISIEFPKYTPYYYSIATDDLGRIYIRRNPSSHEPNIDHEYDVFNKEGLCLYKVHLNYYPDVIKDGYLYTRIANEETGEEQIRRYKIKNWNQIKTGI